MHRVVLLTGSNHPSKERLIARAAELLEEHIGPIESRSEVCYSEAWGFSSQEEFANQALLLSSELEPFEVLDRALEVEQILGRDREAEQAEKSLSGEAYASRVIDVDVIFYDDGWTCIFKCIHGIWFSSYCFITDDGEFHTGYERHAVDSIVNGNAHPATKEQCDCLFQKIKEAGYKWNPETKTIERS